MATRVGNAMRRSGGVHVVLALLVGVGGCVGTLGRYGLAIAMPADDGWPWGTFTANVIGSFLLGLLLELLAQRGLQTPRMQQIRLALGTGVLGGFTTYSSLALEAQRFAARQDWALLAGYSTATLVFGLLAAALGVATGHRVWREGPLPVDPDAAGVTTDGSP